MIIKIPQGNGAYYHAPKCGSRSVMGWIVLMSEPQLYEETTDLFDPFRVRYTGDGEVKTKEYTELIHKRQYFPGLNKHDWKDLVVPAAPADYRFCIVRDPVDRFISGYTNRVLWHKVANLNLSISEFINNIDEICANHRNYEIHFMPQVRFYGKDPSIFTNIFNIKQMGQVKALLEEKSSQKLPDLHMQQNGGIEKPKLTEEQINWVKERYKVDYEVFGKWF